MSVQKTRKIHMFLQILEKNKFLQGFQRRVQGFPQNRKIPAGPLEIPAGSLRVTPEWEDSGYCNLI